MNFFGHGAVASRLGESAQVAFGAMLPDFASMARVRPPRADDSELGRGIDLHHRTDHAFHGAPLFVASCKAGLAQLSARGVDRAPARATCHVGVEMLLDGLLGRDADAVAVYRAALEVGRQPTALDGLAWHRPLDAGILPPLLGRLQQAPIPEGYRDPAFVADRLFAILARRPRLALPIEQLPAVRDWAEGCLPSLEAGAEAMLADILDALH